MSTLESKGFSILSHIIAHYRHFLEMTPPLIVHHRNIKEQVLCLLEFQNNYPLFPSTQHLEYLAATWGCYLCPLKLKQNDKIQHNMR